MKLLQSGETVTPDKFSIDLTLTRCLMQVPYTDLCFLSLTTFVTRSPTQISNNSNLTVKMKVVIKKEYTNCFKGDVYFSLNAYS
jgi:hypothetical protein